MRRLVLDVSNNAPITAERLRASGAVAVYAKATEGATFRDHTLAGHRQAAHAAGVAFGSYLFLHPRSEGNEAHNYLEHARPRAGELQPVIDAEVLDGGNVAGEAERVARCARALEAEGFRPILYASASFWQGLRAARPSVRHLRVWEADYPGRYARWLPWLAARRIRLGHDADVVMWQWTDRYAVQGHGYDASRLLAPLGSLRIG
jgi:lysozyme